jgi:predicted ATPase/DNA-binding SARP family transcriptional activator
MAHLSLQLLGAFRMTVGGVPLNGFRTNKTRALLAYIAVEARPHERDHLAGLLWPEYPDPVARTYLRQALSNLCHVLDTKTQNPLLLADRHTVQLNPMADLWLDTAALRQALPALLSLDQANVNRLAQIEQAISLFRGDFLEGFCLEGCETFQEWQLLTGQQILRQVLEVLVPLVNRLTQWGDYAQARRYAWRCVELDPWLEEGHRQLMRLLAQAGELSAALAHYEQYRRGLAEDLGIAPETATRALYESIKRCQAAESAPAGDSEPSIHTALDSAAALPTPHNLTAPLTPLVGRNQEQKAVQRLLRRPEVRLVTLTGTGGVGKTRLSQEIAAGLLGAFPDGVYFVSLAPTREPALISSIIARTLGLGEARARPVLEMLKAALRSKSLLLVLDNFEHVISAAPVVAELLGTCPRLKVLATSREVLNLSGEHEYVVPPLALPPHSVASVLSPAALTEYSAVEVFRQRAVAARHDFVLDEDSAAAVVEICTRLDGLPLAIELAAALVKYLAPRALLGYFEDGPRIAGQPPVALRFLKTTRRDVPWRHRSLWDTMAWSYALLDEPERAVFRRLAVFVGGWTVAAAEAMYGQDAALDMWDHLTSLRNKHLVQPMQDDGNAPRFTMLETLREFGGEQLRVTGELRPVQERMARYFVRLAEETHSGMHGPRYADCQKTMLAEHVNIRAALSWALSEREVDISLRLCAALHLFWNSYPREAEESALAALTIAEGSPPSVSLALTHNCAGYYSWILGKTEAAYQHFKCCLAMNEAIGDLCDPTYMCVADGILAWITFDRGDYDQAKAHHLAELARAQRTGNEWALAMVLCNMGDMCLLLGDYDQARRLLEEALQHHRRVGQAWGIAKTLSDLGALHIQLGEFAKARQILTESLALAEKFQTKEGIANAKLNLGLLAMQTADYLGAVSYLKDTLIIASELGNWKELIYVAEAQARLMLLLGKPDHALRLASAVASLRVQTEVLAPPTPKAQFDVTIREARQVLGEESASAAWNEGAIMTADDLLEYALNTVQVLHTNG